jgi:hypothetical protein
MRAGKRAWLAASPWEMPGKGLEKFRLLHQRAELLYDIGLQLAGRAAYSAIVATHVTTSTSWLHGFDLIHADSS